VLLSLMVVPGCWLWDSGSPQLLFVPDTYNSRVLLYDSPSQNGQAATSVLGQNVFTNGTQNFDANPPGTTTNTTADSMYRPSGLALDSAGNLYVSDTENCRILQFSPPFTNVMGKNANFALGQPNLTTNTCNGANVIPSPIGLAFDKNGNLWVADFLVASQVLKFAASNLTAANAASATPSVIIGTTNCGTLATANGLCDPSGVAFDSSGNLWVSDTSNSRVLMFPSGNLVTGASATFVLGQTATSGIGVSSCNQSASVSASTLCRPAGID
jgi:secreted PhoX family phosphatase